MARFVAIVCAVAVFVVVGMWMRAYHEQYLFKQRNRAEVKR